MNHSTQLSPNPHDVRSWSKAIAKVSPQYAFSATSHAAATRWQRALRRQFIKRLGGFPEAPVPLRPRVLERVDRGDYIREAIGYNTRKGLKSFAFVLVPKKLSAPAPGMLCLHGHGYGLNAVVGLDGDGKERDEPEYHNDMALQAVRRGYVVMAPEILGFGRRTDAVRGIGASSCQTLSGAALMLGQTMAGWRVYEAMRGLDYLAERPEVDARRLGAMGISGGGLNTLFLAAVDTRVRAALVSGFLNTFRDSIMAVPHCIDNFVPGLLQDAEMSDIAGLVAPRALWCENGTEDTIFPVAAFRKSLRDVKHIYQEFGAPEKIGGEVFKGDHFFHGGKGWAFLERNLRA